MLGVVVAVIGVGGPFLGHYVIKQGVNGMVVIDSKSSTGYDQWQSNTKEDDPPMYMKFYMYNVTNPNQVSASLLNLHVSVKAVKNRNFS